MERRDGKMVRIHCDKCDKVVSESDGRCFRGGMSVRGGVTVGNQPFTMDLCVTCARALAEFFPASLCKEVHDATRSVEALQREHGLPT
jgi:hypothetical protein